MSSGDYSRSASRETPGCVIFLLDHSYSMTGGLGGSPRSKRDALAVMVNRFLADLILKCEFDGGVRHYFDVGVIRYTTDMQGASIIGPALRGDLSGRDLVSCVELGRSPSRVDEKVRDVDDGEGGLHQVAFSSPVWYEAPTDDEMAGTPTSAALRYVTEIASRWCLDHPGSFPPVVVHVTDGESTDGDPEEPAGLLRTLGTLDGGLLLFNCHLSDHPAPGVLFPTSEAELPADPFARLLFRMSSVMPDTFRIGAESRGINCPPGARGMAFNADFIAMFALIQTGTTSGIPYDASAFAHGSGDEVATGDIGGPGSGGDGSPADPRSTAVPSDRIEPSGPESAETSHAIDHAWQAQDDPFQTQVADSHQAADAEQVDWPASPPAVHPPPESIPPPRLIPRRPVWLPPLAPAKLDDVQFTVYRPKVIRPGVWSAMLAFMHLADRRPDAPEGEPDPIEQVREQARQVLGPEIRRFRDTSIDARAGVPREAEILLVPHVPGVEFNPERRAFRWMEDVHREDFRLRADAALDGQTARGRLAAYMGVVLIAEVDLAIKVDSSITRETAARSEVESEPATARPYHKIFASYSHKDLEIVRQVERFAAALGHRYLRDVCDLRSGEAWDEGLLRLIDQADVFQLFWSRHAMISPYVRREWEYALTLDRPSFIRPTYWEKPLPAAPDQDIPPDSLKRLHFHHLGREDQAAVAAVAPIRYYLRKGGDVLPGSFDPAELRIWLRLGGSDRDLYELSHDLETWVPAASSPDGEEPTASFSADRPEPPAARDHRELPSAPMASPPRSAPPASPMASPPPESAPAPRPVSSVPPMPRSAPPSAPTPQPPRPSAPMPQPPRPSAPMPQPPRPSAPTPQSPRPSAPMPRSAPPSAPTPQSPRPSAPMDRPTPPPASPDVWDHPPSMAPGRSSAARPFFRIAIILLVLAVLGLISSYFRR